jgi:hypothetical protein
MCSHSFSRACMRALFLTVIVSSVVGCASPPRQTLVITRSTYVTLSDWHETYDIEASCATGEQMLGGGYVIHPSNDFKHPGVDPIVIASYPSSPTTWHVTLFNPDPKPDPKHGYVGHNSGVLVGVDCYCLIASQPSVGMHFDQATDSNSNGPYYPLPGAPQVLELDVPAPAGAIVTGGGFKIENPDVKMLRATCTFNANIAASRPLINASQRAAGWHVAKVNYPNEVPQVTAFVCYATNGLKDSPVVSAPAPITTPPALLGPIAGDALCAADEFSSGGGFDFNASYGFTASWITQSSAPFGLPGWHLEGNAYYIPNVFALCIKLPAAT